MSAFIGLIFLIALALVILTPLFEERKQKPKSAKEKVEEALKAYLNELGEKK